MSDSCSDSKVDPGLAVRYSILSVLRTSTMKSEPGFSMMRALAAGRAAPVSRATADPLGACAVALPPRPAGCWALVSSGLAAKAAAPTAAPFRKPRRPTERFVDFAMCKSPSNIVDYLDSGFQPALSLILVSDECPFHAPRQHAPQPG